MGPRPTLDYDDTPWTADEMDQLAAEIELMLDDNLATDDPE